ncbi:hydroxysqualene dehydroxylase HpnE [Acetobacter sp. AN02]|uniref:hydroxysqualene dehydroxylase HpnE n=1 Tax=Acetobacter sp. AN02 TaxID=2894186 RepID=UPI0024342B56|nr:hydroxysqualene dehydroxylase HpnE [Acetobacter sp. AN02]MDG6094004.1 hydroxysqualene dehydroxylase HpnE [Acetobacter sp. AN02]
MMGHVHIIGGGMAGLAAAVEVAGSGQRVTLYEAGPACGGRARSYEDRRLGCRIDNGNHLLLSANDAVFRYLGLTGALGTMTGPERPVFPFADLADDLSWTLRLSGGVLPLWVLSRGRRVPGMRIGELLSLRNLLRAGPEATVEECLIPGALSRRLLDPFSVSALNTPSCTASAQLLGNVIRESLARGGAACLPRYPAEGMSESLVDPAVAHLSVMKAEVRTGARLSWLEVTDGSVTALLFGGERIVTGPEDSVILAVTAPVATDILTPHLPRFQAPDEFESIFNAHYRLERAPEPVGALREAGFMGVIGGITEWIWVRRDIVSVTVSAANRYAHRDPEELGDRIWDEVRRALDPHLRVPLPPGMPPRRLVREKRATFAATSEQERRRPGARTGLRNLALAGDWTATGLPCTIEGAMRSGAEAVRVLGLRA